MIVKICGIQNTEDALHAAAVGADLCGLIFVPQSKRFVTPSIAKEVVASVRSAYPQPSPFRPDLFSPPSFSSSSSPLDRSQQWRDNVQALRRPSDGRSPPLFVGVFQHQPISEIAAIATEVGLDLIQLHGREDPVDAAQQLGFQWPTLRVIHVDSTATLDALLATIDARARFDYALLLDTAAASGSGGLGLAFDWSLAGKLARPPNQMPFLLAGGLRPEQVKKAILEAAPAGVDVSSGVEKSPGVKDPALVEAFVKEAKETSLSV